VPDALRGRESRYSVEARSLGCRGASGAACLVVYRLEEVVMLDYKAGTKRVGGLWQEFKAFAFKGNLIELAVAVVIGAAFTRVINSLVTHVVMPLLSYVTPSTDYSQWKAGKVLIGLFLNEVIQFLIVALAIFIVIQKIVGTMIRKAESPPAASEPTTKECPMCLSVIPVKARKCGHCTSELVGGGQ
jgi:large conductance mechanosensitive channel